MITVLRIPIRRRCLAVAALAPWLVAGCGDDYPDAEMHLGLEDKIRPFGVVVEPPDVSPGDTLQVTLRYHAPRPSQADERWRVALDYATGLYDADEVERRYVALDGLPAGVVDDEGFVTRSFAYVVPDSVLLWTSAIPDLVTDELMVQLIAALLGDAAGNPPRKTAVDAWLRALTPDDLAAMDPTARAAALRLADLFACRIRFRATLEDGMTVDATRTVTVRHSRRLESANVNENAAVTRFAVGGLPYTDVDLRDLDRYADEVVWYGFTGTSANGLPLATVPGDPAWTYFVSVRFAPEPYTSPYEPDRVLSEVGHYRWYYYRVDAPGSGHVLLANEEGEVTEMWELDEDVRLLPPGGASLYRLFAVVYDERPEWERYQVTWGSAVTVGEVRFAGE